MSSQPEWTQGFPLEKLAALAQLFAEHDKGLALGAFCSVWIVLVTFPDGTTGLYDWAYLATAMLAAGVAAVSLLRPDPLRLRRQDSAVSPYVR